MRINVAFFDEDTAYLSRLQKGLQIFYQKEMSVKLYSDEQLLLSELDNIHFDILIVNQNYMYLFEKIHYEILFAVLIDDNSIEAFEGVDAIGRYQSVEIIYRRIIGICANNAKSVEFRTSDKNAKIVMFTSAQGGAGVSTLAAAYSVYASNIGKKVLYLNLDNFGTSNCFFIGDGYGSFSDVIYALKRKNVNASMKIKSVIKRDRCGVEFIDECCNAYDMIELNNSEIKELLQVLSSTCEYTEIVVDYSAAFSDRQLLLMRDYADSIIYVNDGTMIGNTKYIKFCETLRVVENKERCSIINKIGLLYNRFSSKRSTQIEAIPTGVIGGINRIEDVDGRLLIVELARKEVMDRI